MAPDLSLLSLSACMTTDLVRSSSPCFPFSSFFPTLPLPFLYHQPFFLYCLFCLYHSLHVNSMSLTGRYFAYLLCSTSAHHRMALFALSRNQPAPFFFSQLTFLRKNQEGASCICILNN